MKAVVDASVLFRSVVPGPETDRARQWLAATDELCAPHHLWYEISSTLRRLEYMKALTPLAADRSLEQLLALPVALSGTAALYKQMLRLARQLGVARTYDMAYLALAIDQKCPLATVDARLMRNAKSEG